jgi:hypothetical protein
MALHTTAMLRCQRVAQVLFCMDTLLTSLATTRAINPQRGQRPLHGLEQVHVSLAICVVRSPLLARTRRGREYCAGTAEQESPDHAEPLTGRSDESTGQTSNRQPRYYFSFVFASAMFLVTHCALAEPGSSTAVSFSHWTIANLKSLRL